MTTFDRMYSLDRLARRPVRNACPVLVPNEDGDPEPCGWPLMGDHCTSPYGEHIPADLRGDDAWPVTETELRALWGDR